MTAGLSRDDQRLHAERIELWDNFNNCWLALLQRQKDGTQQMLNTGQSPARPQSLLPVETLRRLGEDLIVHADELEKLGLVDYQMGVAEEEILDSKFATAKVFLMYMAVRWLIRLQFSENALACWLRTRKKILKRNQVLNQPRPALNERPSI
jgi:hypothetical protein